MAATAIDLHPHASMNANDEDCEQRMARARRILDDRIAVAPEVNENARIALHRMLEI